MTKTPPVRSLPRETAVMIVGAGPTGLALAISLQQAGIEHVLIDKLPEGLHTSRAGVIHAHTLEMLDELGIAKDLVAHGIPVTEFHIRDRDRTLLEIEFDELPSAHPYLLMVPQDETERLLSERLARLGGRIHRGVTASAIRQEPDGVTVTAAGLFGETEVRARYVVGADGMHSMVRRATGTEFEGGAYEDSFVLADVRMDWPTGVREVSLFFSPSGLVVVAPLPGGRYRVVATVDHAPEHPGTGDIQALLDERGPRKQRAVVREVLWSSRFRIHHRVAKSYRTGRLLLMGDAAHVHSPAGGQGMNTGLVDAVVLGRMLARAIRDGDESGLDEYAQMRRPAAVEVLALAGRLTSMATLRGRFQRMCRNGLLAILGQFPPARKKLLMGLSGLSRRRFTVVKESPQAGIAMLKAANGEGR